MTTAIGWLVLLGVATSSAPAWDDWSEAHQVRPGHAASEAFALPPPQDESAHDETPDETRSEQEEVLAEARRLLGQREYEQMRQMLAPLMDSEDPEIKWQATFWAARAHFADGDIEKSMKLFGRVRSNHEPMAAEAGYWVGMGHSRLRRYRSARSCFSEAHSVGDDRLKADCLYQMAFAHYLDGNHEQAAALFDDFLRHYPSHGLARTAQRFLGLADDRYQRARSMDFEWIASIGMSSATQALRWGESPELSLGANAQVGGRFNWAPRDGLRVSARAVGTRTNYLTGKFGDRQGMVGGVSIFQNLGDTRSISYGLNYSRNQRLDITTGDSETYGASVSFATPMFSKARVGVGYGLSGLRYYSEASSGTQQTGWVSYSQPLWDAGSLALRVGLTDSRVGADHLSYSGATYSANLSHRFSRNRSTRGGTTYTTRGFAAPPPRSTIERDDIQRSLYGEYTQRFTRQVSVTVGWRQTLQTSTIDRFNRTDPAWYVRTSNLIDLRF